MEKKGSKFMTEYINMWKNYVNFSDRTNMRGYWMAIALNFLIGIVLSIIAKVLRTTLLSDLYSLAILIPSLAIIVRRLRDGGKEWPWIFVALIPLVGWVWLIILMCRSSVEDNGVPVV